MRFMRTQPVAAIAFLGALWASAACASPPTIQPGAPGQPSKQITVEESRALSETSYIEEDAVFMQMMIVHHQQAVDMVAMMDERSADSKTRLMGERIALSQASEIAMMRAWLQEREEPVEWDGHTHLGGHHMHHMSDDPDTPVMHGMLSPREMEELKASSGLEFDRRFLTGMIKHHEGAIDMVNALSAIEGSAEDPLLSEFLGGVISDQSAEIIRMQILLRDLKDSKQTESY